MTLQVEKSWIDPLQEAVWLVDAKSLCIVQSNEAAARLLGWSCDEMRGMPVLRLAVTPEDQAFWGGTAEEIARGIDSYTHVLRADGAWVAVARRVAPLQAFDGSGYLVLSMLDRTEQENTERELETLLAELRATLDSAAEGILVCDLQGRIRAFNRRMAQIWDIPERLLVERNDQAVFAHMAAQVTDKKAYKKRLAELVKNPEAQACDVLHLRHGTVVERLVVPQLQRGELAGWVYSFRDITQQQADRQRIQELAYTDALTGLPNYLQFAQRVEAAIQEPSEKASRFAIVFLDLDRFKIVNDSLGHSFGDRVLQLVAERIAACLRQTDMLCRLGGDEFLLYLHEADATAAEGVARRILESMLRPCELDGMGFSVMCSMGIALYPQDGSTLDELIKQADTAMYRVKDRGRGNYSFYQPQMNAHLLSRMKLEHAMRQGLEAQRFFVHYQPQVCLATGGITGAEALLRWNDPELGAVSPGQFIPLAEESGFIVVLGAWVMEQAIREASQWMHAGRPLVVSVNVSTLEFRQPDFVERVTRLLAVHQLPPSLLELELTESIMLQDAVEMEQRLQQLAELGVNLAIDDFGTGYSNLAYLKKLPIHKLKIDQSFIRGLPDDEGDMAIVQAIVGMGQALHIEVVAEGVETIAQRLALQHLHCGHFQGFLCAPALSAREFWQRLAHPGAATQDAHADPLC
ncbi:putative bifunctional diguanylate cyclase/phosphodiesterase [Extensimonas vulgaris]|uniref:PAS domain S-box-containing protein/diguanylate cyclase (GGDEF)-like protein n=1 Tax=Extensimonas vulgaris TaxID=1031594 RepID=A0A369AL20_9BURK|nr:bifunctional diguanylate cyclase/phosphodiesterase [Extensimonas vulgaris]RCX09813.1 PAS domain S-box-containing protein/diguanylate cyclase (GGDEF)-like protein [Extensimonas vulgaris]TWI39443.1 PAS domain S-box-containing protein/diguanylate cyclase (GGDEF)-like protein [Extensimonas vulgaris]TXD13004.1 EAL domain-containing protein [Extensimonas vulgaris]